MERSTSPLQDAPTPGTGERFRGSSDLPLTPEGMEKGRQLAMKFARRGGLDEIMTSNLRRTQQTARMLSQYTHAPITYNGDGLQPWRQGYLEGQTITPEKIALMNHLIKENGDEALPGRGPISTEDGESFNQFKDRTQDFLSKVIRASATDPHRKIGLVTHYRVKKLLESWMRKGMDPSGEIDRDEMIRHDASNNPGGVDRLSIDQYAGPQMSSVDMDSPQSLPGGIYIVRHERTPFNAPASGQGS
jgi:broad specificity phosphatase PhoE